MVEDRFADWEKEPDGNISVRPSMGWTFVQVPMGMIVRLLYADSLQAIDDWSPKALPLHLNAAQARELAEGLLRTADRVDAQKPDTHPQ